MFANQTKFILKVARPARAAEGWRVRIQLVVDGVKHPTTTYVEKSTCSSIQAASQALAREGKRIRAEVGTGATLAVVTNYVALDREFRLDPRGTRRLAEHTARMAAVTQLHTLAPARQMDLVS
jgi:hypothetical protein